MPAPARDSVPNFEVFQKGMAPVAKEPMVTIQKQGALSLNGAAQALLGSPKAVQLLYDRAQKIVGIRAVYVDAANAYPVWTGKGSAAVQVSGSAFVRYYGIDQDMARRWVGFMQGDVLCIDLKEPGTVASRGRRAPSTKSGEGDPG